MSTPSDNSYVDHHSELKDLTVAEIFELNQSHIEDSKPKDRHLIGDLDPISLLRGEYENGSQAFRTQIDALEKRGFVCLRRALGDGDCFYRAIGFAFVQRLLTTADTRSAASQALALLEASLPLLDQAKYEKDIYEDFYEPLRSLIQRIITSTLTPVELLSAFQDPMLSNSIVYFLRLLTSAQMQANPGEYEPFFIDSTMREFIQTQVEALGVEADHMQINALAAALKLNLEIAYLDGHVSSSKVIEFVTLASSPNPGDEPLHLLYRPGHYDILLTAKEAAVVAVDTAL